MHLNGPEAIQVSVSLENLKEAFKDHLYRLGYAKGKDECIADMSFGALTEGDTIPIQFWIEKSNEEVFLVYNGT